MPGKQITIRYNRDIPKLMKYCFLSVISDGANTKMGSIFTPYPYYYAWNKANDQDKVSNGISSLFTMIAGAFAKDRVIQYSGISYSIQMTAKRAKPLCAVIHSSSLLERCLIISNGICVPPVTVKVVHTLVQRAAARHTRCCFFLV